MAFGKRQLVASSERVEAAMAPATDRSDLRAELAAGLQGPRDFATAEGEGSVPYSTVAFLAASLAVMVLDMAVLLIGHNRFAVQTAEILQDIDIIYGKDLRSFATIALFASVWSGARAAAAFTLPAHFVLRRLTLRSIPTYALGAAAASIFWLVVKSLLQFSGVSPATGPILVPIDWLAACASGLVAGATYRIVAGSRGS
jgi:hypothetical protein